ncbi:uncharacterized protein Fot_04926 [Forsythia ovata]|uniref:Uncharacterized protein n=1 Tax=Forsythia ovata TaxID=205694 RepID=A0ABD1WNP2_9LAMI
MAQSEIKPENEVHKSIWSEEQEGMPLKQRLKLLLASQRLHFDFAAKSESEIPVEPINSAGIVVVKKENEQCDSQHFISGCFAQEEIIERVLWEQRRSGGSRECKNQETVEDNCMNTNQMIHVIPTAEKVDSIDETARKAPLGLGFEEVRIRTQIPDDILDELDHIVLKERLRRLLTSKSLGLLATTPEDSSSGLTSSFSADRHKQRSGTRKSEQEFGHEKFSSSGNQFHEIDKTLKSGSFNASTMKSSCRTLQCAILEHHCQENRSTNLGNVPNIHRNNGIYSSEKYFSKYESNGGQILFSGDSRNVPSSAILSLAHVKVEPSNHNEFERADGIAGHMSFDDTVPVKSELELPDDSHGDDLDHIILQQRMRLFSSKKVPHLSIYGSSGCPSKLFRSDLDCRSVASEPAKPLKVNRPRKRRKTVTDSVETAMEEDAPGLLQVLLEKGVSIGEIKLFGASENNDALDDSSTEDNFAELEDIISKLFSQRHSSLKLAPLRHAKGEKATYCLACLFSLVEQARYLQFRKWPVEWGWCRDLQSFIFVFERHNRMVLERPEYGYATYFFDLVDSLPIDWQIKRLVTAMKLSSCGRVGLIENKALLVGEDLTEGEAKVLMEYGWIPNTGLGTMLNYRDRVVHDRRNEKDSSEWRSKIGKLLMDWL